jgi:hypothetical protein
MTDGYGLRPIWLFHRCHWLQIYESNRLQVYTIKEKKCNNEYVIKRRL